MAFQNAIFSVLQRQIPGSNTVSLPVILSRVKFNCICCRDLYKVQRRKLEKITGTRLYNLQLELYKRSYSAITLQTECVQFVVGTSCPLLCLSVAFTQPSGCVLHRQGFSEITISKPGEQLLVVSDWSVYKTWHARLQSECNTATVIGWRTKGIRLYSCLYGLFFFKVLTK